MSAEQSFRSFRVILADDEPDVRDIMALAVRDAGHAVWTAGNGLEALNLCGEIEPEILITDIRMPGMDGLKLLRSVKSSWPETEVIVVTAYAEMGNAVEALRLDASDFILKPVGADSLLMAISRAGDRYVSRRTLRDYTALLEKENVRTARELIRAVDFQKNLIEHSMDGIVGFDREEKVILFNRSAEQVLGISKRYAIGSMSLTDLFRPMELNELRRSLESRKFGGQDRLFLYETEMKGADDRIIPVQLSAIMIPENETEMGMVIFVRDIRQIRMLEREVEDIGKVLHQDKMMSLGRLAASVVHEINNPLTGILNYCRLMEKMLGAGSLNGRGREKFAGYLEIIRTESERCSRIASSLLLFSRKSEPRVETVRIGELVNHCLLMTRHRLDLNHILTTVDLNKSLPDVEGDYNQLQQCVLNLIFNAADAMPSGGKLTIKARLDPNGKAVLVSIGDTGPGIGPDVRDRLFEPFFTTKKEGAGVGLGLSTVYGVMERLHGGVTVISEKDQGSEFILSIPLPGASQAGVQKPVENGPSDDMANDIDNFRIKS